MCNKPKYLSLITISQTWQRRTFKREIGKYRRERFLYQRLCCKPRSHALHTGKKVPWITNDGLGENLISDGSWGIRDDPASGLRLIASFCLDESFPAQERCTADGEEEEFLFYRPGDMPFLGDTGKYQALHNRPLI